MGKLPSDLNVNAINDTSFVFYMLNKGKVFHIAGVKFAYRINIESIYSSQSKELKFVYELLYLEMNHQIIPKYNYNLCCWYAKKIKKFFKICRSNNFDNVPEFKLIKKMAKEENCYFTYKFLQYNKLNFKEKLNLWFNVFRYIYLKKYVLIPRIN